MLIRNTTTMHPYRIGLCLAILMVMLATSLEAAPLDSATKIGRRTRRDAPNYDKTTKLKGLEYLKRFGYTSEEVKAGSFMSLNELSAALVKLQRLAGIAETGYLNDETIKIMDSSRCGNNDTIVNTKPKGINRSKRSNSGVRWRSQNVTWKITRYPERNKDLNRNQVSNAIIEAFRMWSRVSKLNFIQVPSKRSALIEVSFDVGNHNCSIKHVFEDDQIELAHGLYPNKGGDVHFNDFRKFTTNSGDGANLLQVATHEIGHTLGLVHSLDKRDAMYPYYRGYDPNFKLSEVDIKEIQFLYGSKD